MISGVAGGLGGSNPLPTRETSTAARPGFQPLSATRGEDVAGSGQTTGSGQADEIQALLTGIFEALGQSLDNEQSMRLLTALLLIVSLMQDLQGNSSDQAQSLDQLQTPTGQQGYFAASYSETTTIFIQQTSTTTVYGSSGALGEAGTGTGGQLDVAG